MSVQSRTRGALSLVIALLAVLLRCAVFGNLSEWAAWRKGMAWERESEKYWEMVEREYAQTT